MSGKKVFVFEMSDWFQSRPADTLLPPADMEAVRERMQAAIDKDLADEEARRAAAADALGRLGADSGARFEAVDRRLQQLAGRPGEAVPDGAADLESAAVRGQAAGPDSAEAGAVEPVARDRDAPDRDAPDRDAFEPADFDERTAAAVRQWRHDAEVIRDLIIDTLPHERYRPGQVAAIVIRLDSAAEDAGHGRYRAALAACQDAFHELNELRAELELRHAEWLTARREAAAALLPAEHAATGVFTVPLRDAEGRELAGTSFDLDHWSRGASAAVREEVAAIAAELRSETPAPALDRLIAIRDEVAPELTRRWQRAVAEAEYQVHASQVRGNIADDVMVAIRETAGYLVDQWGYEHGDERGGVYGRLRHPGGDQIVIEVMADPGAAPASRVRVLTFDQGPEDEPAMEQRVRAVVEALRARRLPVSDPVREPGAPELEFLDVPTLIRAVVPESFELVRIEVVEEAEGTQGTEEPRRSMEAGSFDILETSVTEDPGFEVLEEVDRHQRPQPESTPQPVRIRQQSKGNASPPEPTI